MGALTSREGESEERRQIVLAVRQFVDKSLIPIAAGHDAVGRYPAPIVAELAELGVLGALVDPERGGLGLDLVATAMVLEELARGWTTPAAAVAGHLLATWAIERFAGAGEREAQLPVLARGERLATTVLGGRITARREGGRWVLDGETSLADNAPRADRFLVRAQAGPGQRLLALVERGARGLVVGEPEATIGSRGLDPAALRLTTTPAALVLDDDDALLGVASVAAAAIAVGVAQAAFEAALRYSQQRTTFGKPLCQHQAVQLKLADMATAITAARLLTEHAAAGEPFDPAAGMQARLAAAQAAADATLESMRIHGGYGYVSEFPVERFYRDAARLSFVPLDDETLRAHIAARLVPAS
ncbi:MAG TPA: acyl-CoA dehydrogenase family protein [Methylomirabilota bacterium]|nr:acyl-CoA dehydrogenase family protein [Methylomirabilota bacterium]